MQLGPRPPLQNDPPSPRPDASRTTIRALLAGILVQDMYRGNYDPLRAGTMRLQTEGPSFELMRWRR